MPQKIQSIIKDLEVNKKVIELIVLLKNHESNFVRERVIRALGRIKDPHTIDPLINVFEDSEVISHAAVWALYKIGTPTVEPLIAALNESNKKGKYAAETLGKIGDSRAIEPLIQVFKYNLHSRVLRETIARALERLAWNPPKNELGAHYYVALGEWDKLAEIGALSINPIIDSLEHLDNFNESPATESLGSIKDSKAVNHLITFLYHKSHFVRANVARALGKIGDFRAIKPLITLLDDEYSRQDIIYGNKWDEKSEMINYSVRNAAVAALRKIAGGAYTSKYFTKEYTQRYWDEEKEFWNQWYENKKEIRKKEEDIYNI